MVNGIAVAIMLGSFVLLILLRLPIAFCLGISSILTAIYMGIPIITMFQRMVGGVQNFSLVAIPFFIIAGEIMGQGGITGRIIKFADLLVGRVRGGLAQVNVLASMFFGGISGSAVADVSSIGAVLIPVMEGSGYDKEFSTGITVTSACQGTIIPPSHNMVIYAMAAGSGLSIGRMFLAGYVPGVMLGISLMILTAIFSIKRGYPKGRKYSWKEGLKIAKEAFWSLMTAVIIIVGVCGGICTATESAALACVYAFILTFIVYRELPLKAMIGILKKSLRTLGMVTSLLATANAFGWLLAALNIPAMITNGLLSITSNKYILLLLINLMLLGLGCIMDMAPLILICTPILLPVVKTFGMDGIQFGIMLLLNLAIGMCTPPVGVVLFAGCSVANIKLEQLMKSMLPFYFAMIVVLLLVTFIPELSLWLPRLVMG